MPLPALPDELAPLAAVNSLATGDPRYVLPYHHFSVVLNKERRLALPRQFWKVVTMVRQPGELSATAYLLSQEQLITGLEIVPEAFSYGAYRTYQVPVRHIEDITGLSFGPLADADPLSRPEVLGRPEAAVPAREVRRPDELEL